MIFYITGKRQKSCQIWGLKKDFVPIKLYEINVYHADKLLATDDGLQNVRNDMQFEVDFVKGSSRVRLEDCLLRVTFHIKYTQDVGAFNQIVGDIAFDRDSRSVFREVTIDLRTLPDLEIQKNSNLNNLFDPKAKEELKLNINLLRW